MPRRRVLLVTPDFPPRHGGIQILLQRAAEGLAAHHEVRVVTLAVPGDARLDAGLATLMRVRRVPRPPRGGQAAAVALLNSVALAEALRFRPEVILSGHIVATPAALAARRLLGVPYLQYVYCDELPHRPRLARRALQGAEMVLALGGHIAEMARRHGADAERIRLVPPGVDPAPPASGPRAAEPTVLTVARIADAYKGHDIALRALPLLAERVPTVRWVFLGDGPLREQHQATARELGVEEHVDFRGAVDDAEREMWLDRANVFALPSRPSDVGGGEGYGLVYLEAGTHGLPCVGGSVGGATDAVVDGLTGLLVDARSPQAVADALAELLLHPARAQAMGEAGRQRAARMSWAAMGDRLAALVEEASGGRAADAPPATRRVLYVNHTARVSGAERSLLDLLRTLPPEVSPVVATPEGDLAERVRALGVPTVPVAAMDAGLRPHPVQTPRALLGMLRASRQVARTARRSGAEVVHANSVRAGLVAVLAARQGAPRPVVHVRDCLPAGPVTARVRTLVDGGAAAVVANSRHTARRWGDRREVDVVYSPVDVSRFDPASVDRAEARRALGLGDGDFPVLAVVGQITPWKGQDDALRAAALLRDEWPGLRLLVVGDVEFDAPGTRHDNRAYAESLRSLVEELGLRGHVQFLGRREDIPAVLRAVDVLLVPSWEEPMGRTVIEGMAMGVCVVATSSGGPAELVEHGRTGYLATPRRPEEWAEVVRSHLRRGEDAAGLSAAARAAALTRDVQHSTAAVLAVYDRITAGKRR